MKNDRRIAPEYLHADFRVRPGDRLHRLIAMLHDTYFDVLSDERLADLEEELVRFRWMNAAGERLDRPA